MTVGHLQKSAGTCAVWHINMHAFQHSNEGCLAVSASNCSVGESSLYHPQRQTAAQQTDLQLTPLQCQVLVLVLGYTVRKFSLIKGGHVSAAFNEAVPDADVGLEPLVYDRLGYCTGGVYAMLGECSDPLWRMWPHVLDGSCGR